jgi:nucleotide-binding universal stress UspA family protein
MTLGTGRYRAADLGTDSGEVAVFSKIVVGTDGYGPAGRAVERAVELGAASNAEVIVVHVSPGGQGNPELLGDRGGRSVDAARGVLADVMKNHGDKATIRTEMRTGSAAEELITVVEEEGADLLVVGNKGMAKRFHTGTVPNRISHHAPCSVLIVHTVEE